MPKLSCHSQLNKQRVPPLKKWLSQIGLGALAYTSICILLLFQQQRLIFFPSRTLEHIPSLYHLRYQNVWLPVTTADGVVQIHGWWIPADKPQAKVLLYLYHNAINIGANISQANSFHKLGYSVLLIDYRGFGLSEGDSPSESQVYQDAQIAWNYLTQQRRIPAKKIFIYGHSLGGAIAINLAVKHPEAAGLIVQSSLTSMRDMTKRFGIFWLLPVDFLLRQRFESLEKIKLLKIPVLFIHGTDDPQIPAEMSQKLFAAAPHPKKLILIPKVGHDNNMSEKYYLEVKQFIENVSKK